MAKNTQNIPAANKQKQQIAANEIPVKNGVIFPAWVCNFKVQAIVIALLALSFYGNTVSNDYALDDTLVINQNEYVLEGIAGIPDILTKDAYESYYKQIKSTDPVSGGRYRPLSMVTFAIEQQFFGAIPKDKVDSVIQHGMSYESDQPYEQQFLHNMHIRHLLNVLWFALSVIVLLYFLRYVVFKASPVMAFLAAILFTIHPIHTEVVANVKSRDEILSLLFICLTFIFAFKYKEQEKKGQLGVALLSCFLALLSKEYAVKLVILLPLAFCLFNKQSLQKAFAASLPYIGVLAVYALIRVQMIHQSAGYSDADILTNPYAYAAGMQKIATEIATSLNYLRLLVFPYPLSSDYSYNQIPYKDFGNLLVWLSLAVHAGLIYGFFYFFKRRNVLAFAIAVYLLNLLLVNNILFDIGATMGERLIYHSSLGFVIAVAYLLYKGMEKIKPASLGKLSLTALVAVLIVCCGFETIQRNAEWKNDFTLFAHDINVVPNSLLVNSNRAYALINRADREQDNTIKTEELHEAVSLLDKVIIMQPGTVIGYLNKGVAYLKLLQPDSVITNLDRVRAVNNAYTQLPELYYNAGQQFYMTKQYGKAINAWQIALKLKPGYMQAQNSIHTLQSLGQTQ
jgi:tetratricopeptide (TPR) repeat protein